MLTVILVAVGGVTFAAASEGSEATETSGSVSLGGWSADKEGSPDRVSEYEPNDGGVDFRLDIESFGAWGHWILSTRARDDDDQQHELDFDIRRSLRSTTTYTALPHRLGHDPLTNFQAVTNHGRVVQRSDLDPDRVYGIRYDRFEHRTEYQPRGAPAWTFGVGYRRQERDGIKQAVTVSHCDTCHVVSQSRPVDERTEDVGLDVQKTWEGGALQASFDHRELRQGVQAISLLFDDALQPELRVPIFDNRLQWDSAQGPQPVHQVPDITKDIAKLRLTFPDAKGFAVRVGTLWSNTENDLTGLSSDYQGGTITAARRLGERWRLRWRARAYGIDNDEVFVDIAEPVSLAGPTRGLTFREIYGFDPDFLRLSALDRDVVESRVDVVFKMDSKKRGSIRLQWDHERVDRDHYQVAVGETETVENVLGLRWSGRPRKGVRLSAGYRHGDVDNPFSLVDGAFSTLESPRVTSPFDPRGAQYYRFQDARIAETTAAPEQWDELKLGISVQLDQGSALSGSYRFWDGENQGGDLTDWSRTQQAATLSYWSTPTPELSWNLAYTWHESELNFPIAIPIFDG